MYAISLQVDIINSIVNVIFKKATLRINKGYTYNTIFKHKSVSTLMDICEEHCVVNLY